MAHSHFSTSRVAHTTPTFHWKYKYVTTKYMKVSQNCFSNTRNRLRWLLSNYFSTWSSKCCWPSPKLPGIKSWKLRSCSRVHAYAFSLVTNSEVKKGVNKGFSNQFGILGFLDFCKTSPHLPQLFRKMLQSLMLWRSIVRKVSRALKNLNLSLEFIDLCALLILMGTLAPISALVFLLTPMTHIPISTKHSQTGSWPYSKGHSGINPRSKFTRQLEGDFFFVATVVTSWLNGTLVFGNCVKHFCALKVILFSDLVSNKLSLSLQALIFIQLTH